MCLSTSITRGLAAHLQELLRLYIDCHSDNLVYQYFHGSKTDYVPFALYSSHSFRIDSIRRAIGVDETCLASYR
jgi:hypothetical protein